MNPRLKYILLVIGSFLVTCAPLVTVLILKWDVYTAQSYGGTVNLCVGGVLALVFLLLKVVGKLRLPRRIILYALVFAFAVLMEAVLLDLKLLSGMALLGEALDYILFQSALKKYRGGGTT